MKKRIRVLSFLLGLILLLSLFASCQTGKGNPPVGGDSTTADPSTTDPTTTETKTPDNDPPEPQVVKIFTADQLLTLVNVINEQGTGEMTKDVTYRLMVDIDLNENWSAEITASGNTVDAVPQAPANEWKGIKKFCGTLDGNGKKITGVYMSRNLNSGEVMGFIDELDGGTIKDLTIENSFISASVYEETEAVYVGGLIGFVSSPSTIENVTVKTNLYVIGNSATIAEGTVGRTADNALTQTGFAFEGTVYRVDVATMGVITPDTSWYEGHESDTEYTLTTAEQLLGFSKLGYEGNAFADKTIKLGADIDLNPGWDATVSIGERDDVSKTATYPDVPLNKWQMIGQFCGVFDGQGHTIRGVYLPFTVESTQTSNYWEYVAMFANLSGPGDGLNDQTSHGVIPTGTASIKNLIILNSTVIVYNHSNLANIRVAGLAAYASGETTVENIYSEMNVVMQTNNWGFLSGVVGLARKDAKTQKIKNVVFNGMVATACAGEIGDTSLQGDTTRFPTKNGSCRSAQILLAAISKTNTILENCLAVGDSYHLKEGQGSAVGYSPVWQTVMIGGNPADGPINESGCYSAPIAAGDAPAGWSYNDYVGSAVPDAVAAMLTTAGMTTAPTVE